ncbi:MAG: DUF2924 domain-containing protein [Hyphomicrobiaceae bacterium]
MRKKDRTNTTSTVGAPGRADTEALEAALSALASMSPADLRNEWLRHYRSRPPSRLSRDLLELGVAWKLQERAFGGLSAATKRQIAELGQTMATKADLTKARAVTLRPGARLIREWKGETHEVQVFEEGFLWRGKTWRSLSAIAREMTGTQWSGPRFFGIGKAKAAPNSGDAATEEGG